MVGHFGPPTDEGIDLGVDLALQVEERRSQVPQPPPIAPPPTFDLTRVTEGTERGTDVEEECATDTDGFDQHPYRRTDSITEL